MRFFTLRLPSLIAALTLGAAFVGGPVDAEPSRVVAAEPEAKRITVAIDPRDVTFTALPGGEEIVALAGSADRWMRTGAPDLPVIRLVVRVEDDVRVESAHVVSERTAALGRHRLAPAPAPAREGEAPRSADPVIYGADRMIPELGVLAAGEGFLRGHRLVHVVLFPLRANPVSGEVELATEMTIELITAPAPATGRRPRAVPWEAKVDATLDRVTVDLRGGAARARMAPLPAESSAMFWSPTYRPTADGSPVEYVIVTSAALESSFQPFADWKTRKGVQAVVRTIEWIDTSYPGVDRAEKLRAFLTDAYENWGTLWVLLGGDSDVIPARYAAHALANPPELIPTDLYFSCLDGNWNADGDELFGEGIPPGFPAGGDSADLVPELYLGRAPVSNAAAVAAFIAKTQGYERGLGLGSRYPSSALLLGEVLAPGADGAEYCEDVRQRLPAGMRLVRMYENYQAFPGSIPEIRSAVIDSINAGFGIVHHVGHGYRNTMSVGDGTLGNSDVDNLTNGDRQSVVYAINCSSAAFDFAAIGERFLKNPTGGGVAYIGSSRVAFSGESRPFQNEFYRLVFADSVTAAGEAVGWSKIPFIGGSSSETAYRWIQFALTLLGDPELPIWRRAPDAIAAASPLAVALGAGSYSVTATVGGVPLRGARATLWKTGDAFATGVTQPDGVATLPWTPAATGSFHVTVTHPDYQPVEKTAAVVPASGPFLHVTQVTINDDGLPPSAGNANGQPDAGERIEVSVRLRNDGSATATGVSGILTLLSGGAHASIVQGTVSYGTLAVGGQSTGTAPFVVDLNRAAPDAFEPVFQLAILSNQGASSDRFEIAVRGFEIEHYAHQLTDPGPGGNGNGVPEPGESVSYRVTVRNNGTGRADGVALILRVLNRTTMLPDPQVTVTDQNASFGNVSPGATSLGDAVSFSMGAGAVVNNLLLELSWRDVRGALRVEHCDLVPPDAAEGLTGDGRVSSIRLHWTKPDSSDVRGYDIYRSTTPQSGFVRINTFTAAGSSTYEDSNLPSLTRYYYYVVARDASFNQGVASPVISATTTPPLASGWPIEMAQQTAAGVAVDDLDRDGDLEIVTGADAIYAWHADGSELRDGDANPLTSGVFATDGQNGDFGFHATPAIADLTDDGDLEIIGVAWREAKVYVWNVDGTLEPGWPQTIGGDFNWASPAVADLDLDGDLEIVVASGLQGKIFAWHHDGTEVADGDGNPTTQGILFLSGSSFLYSSPAIGNIDQDQYPEIVFGTQSAGGFVYALSRTGSVKPGWPRETHNQVTSSPALADLDGTGGPHEVIISSESDSVFVLRGDGSDYPGWPRPAMVNSNTGHSGSPVVADVDGDGNLDVICAANDGRMHVWKRDGTVMPGWSAVYFGQDVLSADVTQSTPTIADVDSDGRLEILIGAENGFVYGWNHDGTTLAGFPISLGGEQRSAVTIWDVDQDNLVELLATSNDRNIYVWDLTGEFRGDRIPWPFFRHDVRNTGCFSTDFTSIGIADPEPAPEVAATPVLYPAFPNPFNPSTTIRFLVPGERGAARPVRLAVYDVEGRLVRKLVDGPFGTGEQAVRWDGRTAAGGRAASGAYFMKLEVAGATLTGKLLLLQ